MKYFGYVSIVSVLTILFLSFFAFKLVNSVLRYRHVMKLYDNYGGCNHSMAIIEDALARYSLQHKGKYPKSLSELVPKYLKKLPICPIAHRDTYSQGYKSIDDPAIYFFCCEGDNHIGPPDTPQVVSDLSFYPPKDWDPDLYLYEKGKMPEFLGELASVSDLIKKGQYSIAVETLDSVLSSMTGTRYKAKLYLKKAYCLLKQGETSAAVDSLTKSLNIGFELDDWEKLYPLFRSNDVGSAVSGILLPYAISENEDIGLILFTMKVGDSFFSSDDVKRLCQKGLEVAIDKKESVIPEFYFRGKLSLLSSDSDKALYFFRSIRQFSSSQDPKDVIINLLAEKDIDNIKKRSRM